MHNTRKISEDIIWVGATDRRVVRFENLFPVKHGMSYNSYVILDDKTALMDTVDATISDVYLENVKYALASRTLDYLIIHHMEPDHCANIQAILREYPNTKIVGNKTTFKFLEQFYDSNLKANYQVISDKESLILGKYHLQFRFMPNVHWPEVMFSYEQTTGILFSADAFGTFGPLDGNLFSDTLDFYGRLAAESRRYYANIIGKYGNNVLKALKKLSDLPIRMILPLHGPIYRDREHINYLIECYQKWASYEPEEKSVLILFCSMYGNTENTVDKLASFLAEAEVCNIRLFDISNTEPSLILSEMWHYSHIVFASPNYNGDLMYQMDYIIREALRMNLKNRYISFISNQTWGGSALKTMMNYFSNETDFFIVGEPVQISSSLKSNQLAQLENLAESIVTSLRGTVS